RRLVGPGKSGETRFSLRPQDESLAATWKEIAEIEDAWTYPREVRGKTPEEIASAFSRPGQELRAGAIHDGRTIRFRTSHGYVDVIASSPGRVTIYAGGA